MHFYYLWVKTYRASHRSWPYWRGLPLLLILRRGLPLLMYCLLIRRGLPFLAFLLILRCGLPLLLILNQQKYINWVAHALKSTKMHKWGCPRLKINKSGSPRLGTTSLGRTVQYLYDCRTIWLGIALKHFSFFSDLYHQNKIKQDLVPDQTMRNPILKTLAKTLAPFWK